MAPKRAATRTYFKQYQGYISSTDLQTAIAPKDIATTDWPVAGTGYQYEIYAMHVYVVAATILTIQDAVTGTALWVLTVPTGDSTFYFPTISPLLVGDNKAPFFKTADGQDPTQIRVYGAIRAVN